jgi:hypothetical protein
VTNPGGHKEAKVAGLARPDGVGLDWAGLGWSGQVWAGLGWAGLGWVGLGPARPGWAGLGWAGWQVRKEASQTAFAKQLGFVFNFWRDGEGLPGLRSPPDSPNHFGKGQ